NAGASAAPSRGFRYPLSLLAIFAAWWAGMAIKPWDRHDWVLENVLAVLFVAGLLWTARRFPLSNVSYTLIFIFLCLHTVGAHYFWGYYLPLDLTMSFSMLYELIEWGTAEAFGGDLGQAYLGTQGDVWDSHKDMAMASLGALISMTVINAITVMLISAPRLA